MASLFVLDGDGQIIRRARPDDLAEYINSYRVMGRFDWRIGVEVDDGAITLSPEEVRAEVRHVA